jgi:phosphate transport system substrate-binding protein
VKKSALDRAEVREFSEFYLKNATRLVREVDYVPLPDADYRAATQRLSQREVGRKPLRAGL